MKVIKKRPLTEVQVDITKQGLEQDITDLEIAQMEQEQQLTDAEIAIMELQDKVGI